jgi:acetyl-CoA carboxylase carboxyltransferase component
MGAEGAANMIFPCEMLEAVDPRAKWQEVIDRDRHKLDNPYVPVSGGHADAVLLLSEARMRLIEVLEVLGNKRGSVAAPQARQHSAVSRTQR